jgi:hypothetical protein
MTAGEEVLALAGEGGMLNSARPNVSLIASDWGEWAKQKAQKYATGHERYVQHVAGEPLSRLKPREHGSNRQVLIQNSWIRSAEEESSASGGRRIKFSAAGKSGNCGIEIPKLSDH